MSVFGHLPDHKQAAFRVYFNDKEQESLRDESDAEMKELETKGLMLDGGDLAFLISDTTGADILGGDSCDSR